MREFIFSFHALEKSESFKVSSTNESDIENFMYPFFSLFPGVNIPSRKINCLHQNTSELNERINNFVNFHKSKLHVLNAVAAFFNQLEENEHFYFIPFKVLELRESFTITNYLQALKTPAKDFKKLELIHDQLFGELLSQYNVRAYGEERIVIGEKEKNKRVCRFCNNNRTPLTFNSRAHAISEALGNKTVILLEECDGCNTHFNKTIELDIIEYFSFFRTMLGIKGKGGEKEYTGKNFEFYKEETLVLKFEADDDKKTLPMNVRLESNLEIAAQNIYKCLCKYFLSVIDSQNLSFFVNTIKWISGEHEIKELPLVATLLSYNKVFEQPQIVTYIRKSKHAGLPYAVGEFSFGLHRLVFILPEALPDTKKFISKQEYDKYWNNFKHYTANKGWNFTDFSGNIKKKFVTNLNIQLNKDTYENNKEQKSV